MKKIITLFSIIVLTFLLSGCSYKIVKTDVQNRSESYLDLQQKCSEGAQIFFNKLKYPETDVTTYTNHYNKQLDKCFILVETNNYSIDAPWHTLILSNAYENYSVGNYYLIARTPEDCIVNRYNVDPKENVKCKSIEEFNYLIKPYLEN